MADSIAAYKFTDALLPLPSFTLASSPPFKRHTPNLPRLVFRHVFPLRRFYLRSSFSGSLSVLAALSLTPNDLRICSQATLLLFKPVQVDERVS